MEKLYTGNEMAVMYGVSPKTVSVWVEQGAPVAKEEQRRGRYPTRLFNKKDLQKWLDEKHRRMPIRKI